MKSLKKFFFLNFQKLAGLWFFGEVDNHVAIYGSMVAEGFSMFQRRSCFHLLCIEKMNWLTTSLCSNSVLYYLNIWLTINITPVDNAEWKYSLTSNGFNFSLSHHLWSCGSLGIWSYPALSIGIPFPVLTRLPSALLPHHSHSLNGEPLAANTACQEGQYAGIQTGLQYLRPISRTIFPF